MSDLDLPLLPGADQIRRRKFATVRRGFDPDQVQDFLNQVATQVETLEGDLREARSQPSSAAEAPAAPAPVIAAPAAAASTEEAYDAAEPALRDGAAKRRRGVDEARRRRDGRGEEDPWTRRRRRPTRSGSTRSASAEEARTKSAAELERAREEADRVLGGLDQRREALLAQMHEMQSRLLAVASDLDVTELEPAAPGATSARPRRPPPDRPPPDRPRPDRPRPDRAPPPHRLPPDSPPRRSRCHRTAMPRRRPRRPRRREQPSGAPAPIGTQTPGGDTDEDAVDPRYEDLWASAETKSVDIPDLSSLDIDFDEEE